jgi:hypothetical protein
LGLDGQVAQLVEQWTENPCVGGSIPPLSTGFAGPNGRRPERPVFSREFGLLLFVAWGFDRPVFLRLRPNNLAICDGLSIIL